MDTERVLTVAIVAFFAGSTVTLLSLTVIGGLTDGQDLLRFGVSAGLGLVVTLVVGHLVHHRADEGQLTERST